MADVIARKCAKCKNIIKIERNNIADVIYYNKGYYHSECFEALAVQRAASKRGNPMQWQTALDNIRALKAETKNVIEHFWAKDDLNNWLLENYNIAAVPTRFWQIVSDLERGVYKGKQCRFVSIDTLLGAWKWGQSKLNEINQYNKSHNKGPMDDGARLMYDLAVLVGKMPNFIAYREKQKVVKNEIIRTSILNNDIDMSKIGQGGKINRKENINDIFNDIFAESE